LSRNNYKSRHNSPIKRGITYTLNTETLDENCNKLLDLGKLTRTNTDINDKINTKKCNRTKTVKFHENIKLNIPRSANHTPIMRSRKNSLNKKNIEISTDTIEVIDEAPR
jgi:hypothetical protein